MMIFDAKKFLAGMLLVAMMGLQIFTISTALLMPKPAQAVFGIGDTTVIVGNLYDVFKDIGIAALREVALQYANKFLTEFIEKVQDKYKIRNYLYYDQVLSDYYLLNLIQDRVSDPDLQQIYNLLYEGYVTGDNTGYNGQPNPNNAVLAKVHQLIDNKFKEEGGVTDQDLNNLPAGTSNFAKAQAFEDWALNPESYYESDVYSKYNSFTASSSTASELEIIVGNSLKSGRIIGGTCSLGYNSTDANNTIALGPVSSALNSLGLLGVAKAQSDTQPLPSSSIQTPITTAPSAGPSDNVTNPITPSSCSAQGGTWQPSALDQARAFIDNPAGSVDHWLNSAINTLTGTTFDPSDYFAAIGSLLGDYMFNQLNLSNNSNVLDEYPNAYVGSTSNASVGISKQIDIDGDGIPDGYDTNNDGQIDVCIYGGAGGVAGPPCEGSIAATTPPPPPPPTSTDNTQQLVCAPSSQTVSVSQDATFTASGGDGNYSWSESAANPPTGRGTSYTANWSAPDVRTVVLTDGNGATATCQVTIQ